MPPRGRSTASRGRAARIRRGDDLNRHDGKPALLDARRWPRRPPASSAHALLRGLDWLGTVLQWTLLVCAIGGVLSAAVFFLRAASQRKPAVLPSTMEEVDWHDPQSSIYCLACHRQVAPAMAGRDVDRGHPQNVPLNDVQREAIATLGTVVGPSNTLICMSCHVLGQDSASPYMLADRLEDSRLCQHCHPGHYARNTPHDLRLSAPDERNRLDQTVAEGGPCSACHLAHRYAREFVPSALDPDGRCITCHQEYHVAEGRPRTAMDHPESHCIQCHNPHDMSYGEFLQQPPNELCVRCHTTLAGGVAAGMHPLGSMDHPVPAELIAAGAQVGDDPQELTCLVCHATHTAPHEKLLLLEPNSNRLCLTCHEEKLARRTHERVLPRHGQRPALDAEQLAVVQAWGTRVGPSSELLCVSCHRVHGGQNTPSLLAFTPKYGETCLACHPRETTVLGTTHDLRTNFPGEKNITGMTPTVAGACSACHLAHGFGRQFASAPGDPAGQCVTCHQPGGCGQKKLAGSVDHPDTKCADCHDPHDRRHGRFLVKPEAELCTECHAEQARLAGGPHDPTKNPAAWPAPAAATPGLCLPCHVPHGGERPDLFRFRWVTGYGNRDGVCLGCHADAAWEAPTTSAAVHPRHILPEHSKVDLALVPSDAIGNKRIGCRTCHDPHGGAQPVHLARVAPGEPTQQLCLHCHVEKEYIKYTGHSADSLARFDFDVDSCKPCHAMHASPDGSWGQMLSPRFLMEQCEGLTDERVTCLPCLGCHHAGGPAPVREVATHPETIMRNISTPDVPGYLPLFNQEGREDPNGQVVCRTCHVSHGRLDLLRRLAQTPTLTADEQHALRTQVRPFIAPNVCTACHGAEARLKFLRFHNQKWRDTEEQRKLEAGTPGPATVPTSPESGRRP